MAATRGTNPIRILSWNLDSFRIRKTELIEILYRLDIDIAAIQETKLTPNQRSTIPGYQAYRRDRDNQGGGVALLIRRGIQHHLLQDLEVTNIEAIAIKVTHRTEEFAVVSCYHPPRLPLEERDINEILSIAPRVVAIGDFNAKSPIWNSRRTNTRGRQLMATIEDMAEVVAIGPDEPTFHGHAGEPDILDITLIKAIEAPLLLETHQEGSTTHNPILLSIGGKKQTPEETHFTKRRTDWEMFRRNLQGQSGPIPIITTKEDLEAAVVSLETDIKTALERATKETLVTRMANPTGELPHNIKELIVERRRAKKRAIRTRTPRDKHEANQLNRRVRAALDELYQERWAQHLASLNPQDRSIWKAFDRVWHNGLLYKMIHAGYPVPLVKLINTYLKNRKIRVRVEEELSTYRTTEAGVPQGAVLSAHLFSIYTSDLPKTNNTAMCLYADDTAILARSARARMATIYLQRAIDRIEEWCNRWRVAINPDKSVGIIFSRRHSQRPEDHVQFNGEDIPWVDSTRYLGVTMDRGLTWKNHLTQLANRVKRTRGIIYPLIGRNSNLSLRNKLLLIKTVMQPQMTYAAAAWGYAAETHLKRLQAVENIALRSATNAPYFVRNTDLYRDLDFTTVREVIRAKAKKTLTKAETHHNELIRRAADYPPEEANRKYKRPRIQLQDPG